jgi:deazaflavin-dependent oxidoreductase (nitroreductase family)
MTREPERMVPGGAGTVAPVRPALVVRVVMRPMTRVLNPLIRKLAGRRHFRMAALLWHVGRRSGRTYRTPVSAGRTGDVVVIALTFGNQSDWSRNVRAAGGCSLRFRGRDYAATQPEFLSLQEAAPLVRAAFGPMERAGFRMLGIKQVIRLQVREVTELGPDPGGPTALLNTR